MSQPGSVRQFLGRVKGQGLHAYGLLTHPLRVLPDFVIIGTQKGGTSSLYRYLMEHPCVARPRVKEVHFFDLNFPKGFGWYRAHFPARAYLNLLRRLRGNTVLSGEATPYYMFHPLVPRRLAESLPQARLIVMLRNPVERAYSHYRHEVRHGIETLSFEDAIEREPERLRGEVEKMQQDSAYYSFDHHHYSYLSRGIYVDQLRRWFELFPRDQILVLRSEDFFADPRDVFHQVLRFLHLAPWELDSYRVFSPGDSSRPHPETRKRLVDYFAAHNRRLEEFLGTEFNWER